MKNLEELGFKQCGNKNNKDEWFYTYGKKCDNLEIKKEVVLFFDKENKSLSIWIVNNGKAEHYEHNVIFGYSYEELHNAIGKELGFIKA
jgi:hypothetical protein